MQFKTIAASILGAGLMLTGLALAQGDAEFPALMKTTAGICKEVGADIKASNSAAADKATSLAAHFKKMEAFWSARGAADAVEFSKNAQMSAAKVSKAVSAGNFDDAGASFKELTANCGGCHNAHREKLPDGTFKIK